MSMEIFRDADALAYLNVVGVGELEGKFKNGLRLELERGKIVGYFWED